MGMHTHYTQTLHQTKLAMSIAEASTYLPIDKTVHDKDCDSLKSGEEKEEPFYDGGDHIFSHNKEPEDPCDA